jgi:large subunit ribosomal protein L22
MKAFLKNYHQSPRKVRLVASLIKGKKVDQALVELDFLGKRAASPIKQLISSAAANAFNNFNLDRGGLVIKELRVDKGIVMKRMLPGARGQGRPLKHRTSHISVLLDIKQEKEPKKAAPAVKKNKVKVAATPKKVAAKKASKKINS